MQDIKIIKEYISYDPSTGVFRWIKKMAKNTDVGSEAGYVKRVRNDKNGNPICYYYIKLGVEMPASQVAWALTHGEWPDARIAFINKNQLDLRIDNLKKQNSLNAEYEDRADYLRKHRAKFGRVWKNNHLQRQFGIGLAEYSQMAVDRNNKCDICGQPEKQERAGKVKALAVDHDHKTGAVRGLLCCDCNQALGKFQDSKDLLTSAIAYLAKHMVS
jgi:hypothetical protein